MFFKRALETPNQLPVILGESLIFSTLTVHPINLTFAYLNLFICFVLLLSLCRSTLFFVCLLCSFVRVCVCLSPLAPYYHTNGHFRFSLAWGLLRMGRKLIVSSRALFHQVFCFLFSYFHSGRIKPSTSCVSRSVAFPRRVRVLASP